MSDTMIPTPQGWYEDPWGAATWRFWDGSEWTQHTSGGDQPASPQLGDASAAVEEGSGGWAPPAGDVPQGHASAKADLKSRVSQVLGNPRLLVGLVVGVLVVGAVLVGALSGSTQRSVTGEFALFDGSSVLWLDVGDGCEGTGGYSDIYTGTQVRISDASGSLIGTGSLGPGEIRQTAGGKACMLDFAVDGLPDSDFYTFEVSHRGELTYSRSEMEDFGWHVSLQLGL